MSVSQSDGSFGVNLVGPIGSNCNQDKTSSAVWTSSNPNVLYYTPPTGTASGKSIPVAGNGFFVVGQIGQATVKGGYGFDTGSGASVTVNVTAPSPQPSPSPSPAMFGNGSQGSLIITSNTDWTSTGVPGGTFYPQFTTLTVNAGVTLTVPSGVNIRCSGAATINGKIVVAPWETYAQAAAGQPGFQDGGISAPGIVTPGFWGGGACPSTGGGSGGGTFGLRASTISIGSAGLISADGQIGTNLASGGGGGVIVLVWSGTLTNQGTPGVSCRGGAGASAGGASGNTGGNGGGGGVILLYGPGATSAVPFGQTITAFSVAGGDPGQSGPNNATNPGSGGNSAGAGGSTSVTTTTTTVTGQKVGKDPAPVTTVTVTNYTPRAGATGSIFPKNSTTGVPATP